MPSTTMTFARTGEGSADQEMGWYYWDLCIFCCVWLCLRCRKLANHRGTTYGPTWSTSATTCKNGSKHAWHREGFVAGTWYGDGWFYRPTRIVGPLHCGAAAWNSVRNSAKNHTLSRIGALEASWNTAEYSGKDSCAHGPKMGYPMLWWFSWGEWGCKLLGFWEYSIIGQICISEELM